MRDQDRIVFAQASKQLKLWILVRITNKESLKYIGQNGFVPKPIECKAKTADIDLPQAQLAGLVANPIICRRSFIPSGMAKRLGLWQDFSLEQHVNQKGSRYTFVTDPASPRYGAVQLNGCFIHGDYDLYDVVDPNRPKGNLGAVEELNGVQHVRGANFFKVQAYVNQAIGIPMVQHSGEMQRFKNEDEDVVRHAAVSIDAFTPTGEYRRLSPSEISDLYAGEFQGRRPVGGESYLPK